MDMCARWPKRMIPPQWGTTDPLRSSPNGTVLGVPIAARHWLSRLSHVVDPFLCGNVVGCRAGMVWRHVLEQVEAAHRDQVPVCGFSADIVKAFNVLPRRPVFLRCQAAWT